tara:strand:+ start:598 stop:735 length:138 start_codon:yes stop_codon:yes gene_type:complete
LKGLTIEALAFCKAKVIKLWVINAQILRPINKNQTSKEGLFQIKG